jgi:two-component system cell cycle sensor histidine kinase/response regulator CckA
VRGSLTRILTRFGYQVLEAEHGADALRVARAHHGPIHLAISDLMMPEMSGREFGEQLVSARPDTRVLFMSGYTDEDVLQRGLVGADQAFIQKPFAIEDITRKVHDVLRTGV